jgi:catechol 2,3-dioxygenase-like lactoylglutathione lyase family enzyme
MALDFVSVVHVNVNCSRLERSLAFYRDALGLAPLSHTNPLPQDGAGFGLPGRVQWDAWILHDDRGAVAQGIDLLEWKLPAPTGRPAPANALGFERLSLRVRDARALHARLAAAGARPLAAPGPLGGARRGIVACDPDGALVELVESPDGPAGPRLAGVVVGVASLSRAVPWYERLLGLRAGAPEECEADGAALALAGGARWREATLEPTPSFAIRLVEWMTPVAPQTEKRTAHALGLYRMALLVDDAAKACAELTALGIDHSGAVCLDMGPDLPIDGLRAGFFFDPDGACLEWIERPRRRLAS